MIDRLAAAPISWGICEAPGWGLQMSPRSGASEMREFGIQRTELGALGWLPTDPTELADLLTQFELSVLGGFVPLVLHESSLHEQALVDIVQAAKMLSSAGATFFVTAIVSSHEAWERPEVNATQWSTLFDHLAEIDRLVESIRSSPGGAPSRQHPGRDGRRVPALPRQHGDRTSASIPVTCSSVAPTRSPSARTHHDRVGLVHIKDVDRRVAARLHSGELSLMRATQEGLFPAAGSGDVPIAATVNARTSPATTGWYVLEQDVALLDSEPALGDGPVHGVRQSIEYLKTLAIRV